MQDLIDKIGDAARAVRSRYADKCGRGTPGWERPYWSDCAKIARVIADICGELSEREDEPETESRTP